MGHAKRLGKLRRTNGATEGQQGSGSKTTGGSVVAVTVLSACAPLTQYRTTDYLLCDDPAGFAKHCETHSLQQLPAADGVSYLLGFVEFDDQGQIWDASRCGPSSTSSNAEAAENDLLMACSPTA